MLRLSEVQYKVQREQRARIHRTVRLERTVLSTDRIWTVTLFADNPKQGWIGLAFLNQMRRFSTVVFCRIVLRMIKISFAKSNATDRCVIHSLEV